jgi:3-oxoacyl-[acyl-carrier protein] reductase
VEALGALALGVTVDVSNPDQVAALVEQCLERFGRIDVLVNVAGGSYSRNPYTPRFGRGTLLEVSPADFMGAFEVNVKGTFLCARAVVPTMKKQGKGVIINIGSSAGRLRPAGPEMAAYAAAKAAEHSLTINMAHQWGQEVRVNCIAPGIIDTPRPGDTTTRPPAATRGIAVGRLGNADDIGQTALFLASDASEFINGTIIDVNGGS